MDKLKVGVFVAIALFLMAVVWGVAYLAFSSQLLFILVGSIGSVVAAGMIYSQYE